MFIGITPLCCIDEEIDDVDLLETIRHKQVIGGETLGTVQGGGKRVTAAKGTNLSCRHSLPAGAHPEDAPESNYDSSMITFSPLIEIETLTPSDMVSATSTTGKCGGSGGTGGVGSIVPAMITC
jgi:hypothetical protein